MPPPRNKALLRGGGIWGGTLRFPWCYVIEELKPPVDSGPHFVDQDLIGAVSGLEFQKKNGQKFQNTPKKHGDFMVPPRKWQKNHPSFFGNYFYLPLLQSLKQKIWWGQRDIFEITTYQTDCRTTNLPQLQENDNTPLEHTPGNPPSQLWKESLYSLLVKV